MKIRNEVKIGLFALLAAVALYIGINFLKGIDLFSKDTVYHTRFSELGGVATATPIKINGYKVGIVRTVDFGYTEGKGYGADLVLAIDPKVKLPQGTIVTIKTSLLSGAELVLQTDSTTGGYISAGSIIPSREISPDILETAERDLMPEMARILPKLTESLEALNGILAHRSIDASLSEVESSSRELSKLMRMLNQSVHTLPQTMKNVEGITQSLERSVRQVEAIKLDKLVENLEQTSADLKSMTQALKEGEGTAGKLIYDPSLYNRLDSLATSADALMKDLKENPKRYVHFSLF